MNGRPRVLIADDHRAMLDNLVGLVGAECDVVATVSDGQTVVTSALRLDPDVLVLDISMPGLSGIAAASQLKARGSSAKVVFVTMHNEHEFVSESLALGDVGFVVKNRLFLDLLPAIRTVLAGQPFVSPNAAR